MMSALPPDALVGTSTLSAISNPTTLGLEMHIKALLCIEKMKNCFERQFLWINEALVEAKRTFASPEIRMIPKTPSASRSRRLIAIDDEEDETADYQGPQSKKRRNVQGSTKGKRGAQAASSQDENSATSELSADAELTASSETEECSTGRSKKGHRKPRVKPVTNSASGRQTRSSRRKKGEEPEDSGPEPVLQAQAMCEESLMEEESEDLETKPCLKTNIGVVCKKVEIKNEVMRTPPCAGNKTIILLSSDDEIPSSDVEMASPPRKSKRKSSQGAGVPLQSSAGRKSSTRASTGRVSSQQSSAGRKLSTRASTGRVSSPQSSAGRKSSTQTLSGRKSSTRISTGRKSSTRKSNTPSSTSRNSSQHDTPKSPTKTSTQAIRKDFHLLKVKEKANKFDELARTSGGVQDPSPARLTPRSGRGTPTTVMQLNRSKATPTHSPQLLGSAASRTATPPTIVKPVVSHATISLTKTGVTAAKQAFQTLLGDSPKAASPRPAIANKPQGPMRRSTRVSGSKLSLSKRRSSIHRRKSLLRASIGKIQQSTHLETIKARLMNASMASSSDVKRGSPAVVRSTRSKMRAAAATAKPQTPERVPRKLQLSRLQQITGQSSANKVPLTNSTISKSGGRSPASDGDYMKIAPPSTMAPARSTRSKIRQQQHVDNMSSPCPSRRFIATSDEESPKKRCLVDQKRSVSPRKDHYMDVTDANEHDELEMTYSSQKRVTQPIHASSFLNQLKKNRATPNYLNTTANSFLRNTPVKKPTKKDTIELKRQQILAKEELAKNRRIKAHEELLKQAEEKRKIREQRQLLAAQRRKENEDKDKEAKENMTQKEKEKSLNKAKMLEIKLRDDREKQKLRETKLEFVRKREMEKQKEREQIIREQDMEKQKQQEYQQRKREYEQQQRQKQLHEQRLKHEERMAELEKDRQREEERLRQMEDERQREEDAKHKEKEDREKRDKMMREKQELDRARELKKQKQIEQEELRSEERVRVKEEKAKLEEERRAKEEEKRLQKIIEQHNNALKQNTSHNVSSSIPAPKLYPKPKPSQNTTVDKGAATTAMNSTFSKDQSSSANTTQDNSCNPDSYDITPARVKVFKKASADNYNIADMESGDSTDDEEAPRKKIPMWATGSQLKASLITQFYTPPDLDQIFNIIEPPDLCKMFIKKKPKFFKRTSSACWKSPMYLPSGKPHIEHNS